MFLIDSHCHLDQLNYSKLHKDIKDVINKSHAVNVKQFLTVSTSIKNFYEIKKLVKNYNSIFYSCGVHPLHCSKEIKIFHTVKNIAKKIEKLSSSKRVIALGESGLDYHYSLETKNIQKEIFRKHINISIKLNKPIIIHSRNSINDVIKILQEHDSQKCKGILHSFNETYIEAKKLLDLGFYISFSGIITFKNSIQLREIIKKIPLERLLIETDSPYLAPIPYRGKENQPAYLLEIAKTICLIKKIRVSDLAIIINKNFCELLNVKCINK